MIVDSSALVAILKDEPEAATLLRAINNAGTVRISAGTYLEAAVLVDATRDPSLSRRFDDLLRQAGIEVEPVTLDQAEVGRAAYRDFGRGSGHPARLNFGDCFAYALAKTTGEPLLFKGNDFLETDLAPAL